MPQTTSRRDHSLSAAAPLRTCSRVDGDRHVITLSGELDVATAQTLEHELRSAEASAHVVVVDLRELDFIDCSGVRVIVEAHRRAADRLLVVNGPDRVQRVLGLCGLLEVLAFVGEIPDRGTQRADTSHEVTPAGVDRPTATRRHATARRAEQGVLTAAVRALRSRTRLRPVRQQADGRDHVSSLPLSAAARAAHGDPAQLHAPAEEKTTMEVS